MENYGYENNEIRNRVDEALSKFRLESVRRSNPRNISGGEQQRVMIASVWVLQPEWLICDEITTYLDFRTREESLEVIKNYKEEGGSVLFITQYPSEAIIADRLIILKGGEVVGDGVPVNLLSDIDLMTKARHNIPQSIQFSEQIDRLKEVAA